MAAQSAAILKGETFKPGTKEIPNENFNLQPTFPRDKAEKDGSVVQSSIYQSEQTS